MMGREKITKRGLEAAMKEIDKDDSGDIDFEEFESWYFNQDPKDQVRKRDNDPPCLVLSCLVLSCLVLSCLVLSCLVFFFSTFWLIGKSRASAKTGLGQT
eukprot:COSAG06_NODE_1763_length_8449_cov_184.922275_11_plen_100_part_00